jgi:hypothetical protein
VSVQAQFVDGPAEGKAIPVTRTPRYLRVARNLYDDSWRALDALDARSLGYEELHVYGLFERDGDVARYEHVPAPGEQLRETEAWQTWVMQQCEAVAGRVS